MDGERREEEGEASDFKNRLGSFDTANSFGADFELLRTLD